MYEVCECVFENKHVMGKEANDIQRFKTVDIYDWSIDWLVFYGMSTHDWSMCAIPPEGELALVVEDD